MALNASGAISLAGATAGQSIAVELGLGTATQISLNDATVRALAGVPSGAIVMPTNFWGKSSFTPTQKGIIGYGQAGATKYSITNLVTNTGTVGANVTGVGTARSGVAGAGYGGDKGIFGHGSTNGSGSGAVSVTNLVSNTGVVSTDVAGVGTARFYSITGVTYGLDKGAFLCGWNSSNVPVNYMNLISNTGVASANTSGVGTARSGCGTNYGTDKAMYAYGYGTSYLNLTNLISNTGIMATDISNVGTARESMAGAPYSTDKAIIAYGRTSSSLNMSNLVSNTGVLSTDGANVGTARTAPAAARYGGDKAFFAYGQTVALTYTLAVNLVSNTGVVASDTTAGGTARTGAAGCGYSY